MMVGGNEGWFIFVNVRKWYLVLTPITGWVLEVVKNGPKEVSI